MLVEVVVATWEEGDSQVTICVGFSVYVYTHVLLTVTVFCGATLRVKSRWYANGRPCNPLSPRMRRDLHT